MSNLRLGPPAGKEDEVQAISAHRGGGFITIALEMSEEEAKALAERRVLWISFWDINPQGPPIFPPVRPDVMTPALAPFEELQVAGAADGEAFLLQYLTLNLICLPVPEKARDFVFRTALVAVNDEPTPMWDLVFKTHPADLEWTSGQLYFKEALEILGRFSDIPEYNFLKILFPYCPADVLVMRRREAKPAAASIIQLPGTKINHHK